MYRLRHIGLSVILALSFVAFPATAAKKSVPLVEQPAIQIPENVSAQTVRKTILSSGALQRWIPVKDEPGLVVLELAQRAHILRVGVHYDANQIQIRYIDSSHLGASVVNGQQLIHPNYHPWTRKLLTEIHANLLRL